MSKKTVFLDMDGVLCDFNGYIESLGYSKDCLHNEYLFNRNIIEREYELGLFRKLKPLPTYHHIKRYLGDRNRDKDIEFKILSYVGSHDKIRLVIDDKREWLRLHLLDQLEFVPVTENGLYKRFFSNQNTKLLDDNAQIVIEFNDYGEGSAYKIDSNIKHDTEETYKEFKQIIQEW